MDPPLSISSSPSSLARASDGLANDDAVVERGFQRVRGNPIGHRQFRYVPKHQDASVEALVRHRHEFERDNDHRVNKEVFIVVQTMKCNMGLPMDDDAEGARDAARDDGEDSG